MAKLNIVLNKKLFYIVDRNFFGVLFMTLDLRPNEYVKYEAHFSLKVFVMPMLLMSIGIMILLAALTGSASDTTVQWLGYHLSVSTLLLLLGIILFFPYIRRRVDNRLKIYAITNQRVYVRRGIFNIVEKDIPLPKINDVQISHTIIQRMFNAGDIIIQVGNDESSMIIDDIDHPRNFRDIIISGIYEANGEVERQRSKILQQRHDQQQQQQGYNPNFNQNYNQNYDSDDYGQTYDNQTPRRNEEPENNDAEYPNYNDYKNY